MDSKIKKAELARLKTLYDEVYAEAFLGASAEIVRKYALAPGKITAEMMHSMASLNPSVKEKAKEINDLMVEIAEEHDAPSLPSSQLPDLFKDIVIDGESVGDGLQEIIDAVFALKGNMSSYGKDLDAAPYDATDIWKRALHDFTAYRLMIMEYIDVLLLLESRVSKNMSRPAKDGFKAFLRSLERMRDESKSVLESAKLRLRL